MPAFDIDAHAAEKPLVAGPDNRFMDAAVLPSCIIYTHFGGIMLTRLFAILCSLLLVVAVAGCSKKHDKDKDKSKNKNSDSVKNTTKDKSPPTATTPTKTQVAAVDCEKACTTQMECHKKGGIKVTDQMKKMCNDGCKMIKAVYDPKKHAKAAAGLLHYQAGRCK